MARKGPTGRKSLLAEVAAKRLSLASTRAPQFLDPAFPAQTAFISDPSKLKVVLCTRRSGKSYGAGLYLYQQAYETPGASCLYIALTRDSAKKIMWKRPQAHQPEARAWYTLQRNGADRDAAERLGHLCPRRGF